MAVGLWASLVGLAIATIGPVIHYPTLRNFAVLLDSVKYYFGALILLKGWSVSSSWHKM
jgi:hypothetical protein